MRRATRATLVRKESRRRFGFVRDAISELRKVVWPSRRDATRLTVIVVIVCVIVGAFLSLIDYGFSNLMTLVFP